jgi:hypothetical protein
MHPDIPNSENLNTNFEIADAVLSMIALYKVGDSVSPPEIVEYIDDIRARLNRGTKQNLFGGDADFKALSIAAGIGESKTDDPKISIEELHNRKQYLINLQQIFIVRASELELQEQQFVQAENTLIIETNRYNQSEILQSETILKLATDCFETLKTNIQFLNQIKFEYEDERDNLLASNGVVLSKSTKFSTIQKYLDTEAFSELSDIQEKVLELQVQIEKMIKIAKIVQPTTLEVEPNIVHSKFLEFVKQTYNYLSTMPNNLDSLIQNNNSGINRLAVEIQNFEYLIESRVKNSKSGAKKIPLPKDAFDKELVKIELKLNTEKKKRTAK